MRYLTFNLLYNVISNRKKDNSNNDATGADVSNGESRVIVRTTSESGIVNDGYRWRKYGQKMVKGNTNPRYTLAFIMNWYGTSWILSRCIILSLILYVLANS
jgi:hypothetical protein